ncbi:MAG TPA: YegP family protein [Mycobacteriales bacterium]|nr:YegP family protein [Mycobacteriales bacterium]
MPSKVLLQKNTRTGKFRFSLLSARGQVIVASEPYESKRGAMAALNAFRKNAADAILVDETEPKQPAPAKKTAARAAKTTASRAAAAVEGNGRRTTRRATAARSDAASAPAKTTAKTTARRPRRTEPQPQPVAAPEES